MDDFPDPDEVYESMYEDELEALREQEAEEYELANNLITDYTEATSPALKENQNPNISVTSVSCSKPDELSTVQNEIQDSNSKKRSIQELFGDIDDLLMEGETIEAKRYKSNKIQDDLALIDNIISMRKLKSKGNSLTSLRESADLESINSYNWKFGTVTFIKPDYPHVIFRRDDKIDFYIKLRTEQEEQKEREEIFEKCDLRSYFKDSFKEVWKEAQEITNKRLDAESQVMEVDRETGDLNNNSELLVDVYKPKGYLELLSDESTNRVLLKWIKLWDKCVFKKVSRVKRIKNEQAKVSKFPQFELSSELDEFGRPQQKLVLLCGPPGLGKTTLARIVAKQAGYNVVEINASDERSLDAFKTVLENATTMSSVLDSEQRPNCIVFDEIEGAPANSIEYLVKYASGNISHKSKKAQNAKKVILKRPIICICNDAYVPALKSLRQNAFVIRFPQTSGRRLAERLMEIAKKQNVKTDLGAMFALAEKTNNDIRSCLSVLHFFKSQNKAVTLSDIMKSDVGRKDIERGMFSVWEDLFSLRLAKNNSVGQLGTTRSMLSLSGRSKKVVEIVTQFGDYDRLAQGVYENFVELWGKSPGCDNVHYSLDWFCMFDIMNRQIQQMQNYSLGTYLPWCFVVWHFIFAKNRTPQLHFPNKNYEMKVLKDKRSAIISELMQGMPPSVRVYCQKISLVLDTLPFVSKIIVPNLRPVSLQLFKDEERAAVASVVGIMADYCLNYVQERNLEGTYVFNLDPDIEELVRFSGVDSKKTRSLTYSNKQAIAREVEMEKMRRFEASRQVEVQGGEEKKDKGSGKKVVPNHLQKLKARAVQGKDVKMVARDFFGNAIKEPASSQKDSKGPKFSNDIWFKYKEGYSNAVRKTITISGLLKP